MYYVLVFPDYTDAVEKAPFDIDKNHMKIPTNEERIKVSQRLKSLKLLS